MVAVAARFRPKSKVFCTGLPACMGGKAFVNKTVFLMIDRLVFYVTEELV